MSDTNRLLEAAKALSVVLQSHSIPHAFHGSVITSLLTNSPRGDELFCVVEGGSSHPFRRVREAVRGNDSFTTTHSPWSNRLHVTYRRLIPAIEIEILPAGEHGPRRLDNYTTMKLYGIPFLTLSEFVRAKLKSWAIRGSERDAHDIVFALCQYWNRLDINRVPEHDMNQFVTCHRAAALSWAALKRKYGM
ncbi:hypothetical protein CONPUDRAFT_147736 [Coniophora puteana RWD-64-598 SS2]|uniref:Uncharacterized protein n=1 Tax=Coniophora puteana (strain RWD-64-598) TaxID=741705 RepID=R7SF47_CONPW|nr:uncharacterized protein CONPUDRAFT_147736 [Coniophora puteana RWD-64-598 SS2]EIW74372.1 hypothetical protein CONPUDRAFT_147736 [Coniophora puteana RWD-64-598 SS2]